MKYNCSRTEFDSCCIHIRNDNYAYCKYRVTTTIRVVCIKCTVNIHMFAPCLLCCILQGEHNTPYPIVQVTQEDWKSTFEGRSSCSLKVDRVEVCEGMKVEEAMISSFYSYFVFNLEYQPQKQEHSDLPPAMHCENAIQDNHVFLSSVGEKLFFEENISGFFF